MPYISDSVVRSRGGGRSACEVEVVMAMKIRKAMKPKEYVGRFAIGSGLYISICMPMMLCMYICL